MSNRVLVVDDNPMVLRVMLRVLEEAGFEAIGAGRVRDARGAAGPFAALVLDIGLPKLSGYDVCRRIRGERGGQVRIIAITGWGQDEDRRRAHEAGFDHHFTKPVDFDALLALMEQLSPTAYQ